MQTQPTPALTMTGVEKLYTQWQRSNKVSELLRSLIQPQKRTIAALHDLNLTVQRGEMCIRDRGRTPSGRAVGRVGAPRSRPRWRCWRR